MKNVLCILMISAITCWPTVLGDLAASLQPGEWAILNEHDDGSGFSENFLTVESHNILEYASKGTWDSHTKRFLFVGQGHYSTQKFISYNDATDKWQIEPKPYWDCSQAGGGCIGHAYEHNTINPVTGDFYYGFYGWTRKPVKLTRATDQWTELPQAPSGKVACCAGFVYFPEMGGLILAAAGYVHFLNENTNQWSTLASGLSMGPYHHFATYNPKHKVVICGGGNGSSDIYKVDAGGKVIKMKNAPFALGTTSSLNVYDPASGKFLVFGRDESFYEYDVSTDTWTRLSSGGQEAIFVHNRGSGCGGIAAPVSTYGVIMVLTWDFHRSKVLVYKHAAGTTGIADLPVKAYDTDRIMVAPNPFRGNIAISCQLSAISKKVVPIKFFNVNGKLVTKLKANSQQLKAGITWNPFELAPGIYLLKVQIGNQQYSKKLILQK